MFIQTEDTPNPQTLKFIPGVTVLENDTLNITSKEEAARSPLAEALFTIPNVQGVFLGSDFISITKSPEVEWDLIKPEALTTIMEHFVAGLPVLSATADTLSLNSDKQSDENDSEIVKQIKELIETRVRPAVAQDGGDIIYHDFKDGVVYLEMHGACSGCPSSTMTLKSGIENMLMHYIPEVQSVEAVAA